jgi:hypothetical protein
MKILTNYDFKQNEIQNVAVQRLATAPTTPSPVKGQIYFDTTANRLFCFNGTEWIGADSIGATMTGDDIITALNGSSLTIDNDNLSSAVNTAINNSHIQNTDVGTSSSVFQIGTGGSKLKNNSGEIQIRNSGDSDYADLRVKNLTVEGTTTTIYSETIELADNKLLLNSNIITSIDNDDGGIAVKRLDSEGERKDAELFYDTTDERWKTIQGYVEGTLVSSTVANKVIAQLGNGSLTSIPVTHNLNTRDCVVTIRENVSPYAMVITDMEFTDLNTITFKFAVAPTTNQYTATIIG